MLCTAVADRQTADRLNYRTKKLLCELHVQPVCHPTYHHHPDLDKIVTFGDTLFLRYDYTHSRIHCYGVRTSTTAIQDFFLLILAVKHENSERKTDIFNASVCVCI